MSKVGHKEMHVLYLIRMWCVSNDLAFEKTTLLLHLNSSVSYRVLGDLMSVVDVYKTCFVQALFTLRIQEHSVTFIII